MSANYPVYIVDDDPDVREGIAFMLRTFGRDSRCFATGEDLLQALEGMRPGPILLDLRMPDTDGMRVLEDRRLRDHAFPVVIMTGHGEAGLAVRALKTGAVDFLEKPFEQDLLLTALANADRRLEPQPLP